MWQTDQKHYDNWTAPEYIDVLKTNRERSHSLYTVKPVRWRERHTHTEKYPHNLPIIDIPVREQIETMAVTDHDKSKQGFISVRPVQQHHYNQSKPTEPSDTSKKQDAFTHLRILPNSQLVFKWSQVFKYLKTISQEHQSKARTHQQLYGLLKRWSVRHTPQWRCPSRPGLVCSIGQIGLTHHWAERR